MTFCFEVPMPASGFQAGLPVLACFLQPLYKELKDAPYDQRGQAAFLRKLREKHRQKEELKR
jgi:hypothetical protein